MQISDDLKLMAWPTRVRFDEDDNTSERLAFELEVNGERMVMLSLEQMLDALWTLEDEKLVAPLASSWWSKAELNKQWGKPVVTASSESRLDSLDMKFAAEHARKATKAITSPFMLEMLEEETGVPYLLLEQTLLQCVYIAEQLGAIPPLDDKWLARAIPPSTRQLSQIQKPTGLH
ncbi:hypothetical protein [Pseudomonas syringae]|uniref:hypothetical protein n=1 Tax=Pseudomonas syringae TaxID=317 RepID=UPI000CDAFAA9|nr:hypothetical protein [Pseudomonas syringae]POR66261.1 hypothetical protein BKM27_25320 [Pseudomonas syringae pv. syringae]POR74164.1 hypothetical protein BKM30_25025 [Pseudomonas syringae pv. syringae]